MGGASDELFLSFIRTSAELGHWLSCLDYHNVIHIAICSTCPKQSPRALGDCRATRF